MLLTQEFKELIFVAVTQFRWLNRNKFLSRADKKQLKTFFLEQLIAPYASNTAPRKRSGRGSLGRKPPSRIGGDQMFTAKEVEAWLRVDRKTLYAYAHKGLIPHVRIKRSVRFPARELQQWVRKHFHARRRKRTLHRGPLQSKRKSQARAA